MVRYAPCIQLVTAATLIKYIMEPQLRSGKAYNWTVVALQIDLDQKLTVYFEIKELCRLKVD